MTSWLCVRPVFTNLSDMKLKNIVINGSLLILSVIAALVIGELFIRNFYPQPIYAVTYAPWGWKHAQIKGGVSFNRGMETRENISRITYNSFGLRNTYDPVVPKPANVYRTMNRIVKFLGFDFISIDWVPQVKRATLLEQSLNIKKEINNAIKDYPILPVEPTTETDLIYLEDDLVTTKEMGLSWAVFSFINELAKKNDARLIIATMRIERGIENLPKRASFFKAIGADFINLYTPDNNFHYKYDGHWNAIGHFRTGTLLARHIFDNYLAKRE